MEARWSCGARWYSGNVLRSYVRGPRFESRGGRPFVKDAPHTHRCGWSVDGVWGTLSMFILRNREVASSISDFAAGIK